MSILEKWLEQQPKVCVGPSDHVPRELGLLNNMTGPLPSGKILAIVAMPKPYMEGQLGFNMQNLVVHSNSETLYYLTPTPDTPTCYSGGAANEYSGDKKMNAVLVAVKVRKTTRDRKLVPVTILVSCDVIGEDEEIFTYYGSGCWGFRKNLE